MPESIDRECKIRIISMFDSYCKTVLRNTSRNLKRKAQNISRREITVENVHEYITDLQTKDIYPSEQYIISCDQFACVVYSETLFNALLALPHRQRMVLLLDFWYGWKDREIAHYMKMTTRTVYNLRQRAFVAIRNYYERGLYEEGTQL